MAPIRDLYDFLKAGMARTQVFLGFQIRYGFDMSDKQMLR